MPGGDPVTEPTAPEVPMPAPGVREQVAAGLERRPATADPLAAAGAAPVADPTTGETPARPAPEAPAETPTAAGTVRERGSAAVPRGEFRIPSAKELAQRWHQNNLDVADDPVLVKMVQPMQEQLRKLAVVQHHNAFRDDPMASPEAAARYARHWELGGMFGEPMTPEAAAKWGDYVEGSQTKRVKAAKEAMMRGDLPGINRYITGLMPEGWQATGVEESTFDVAGTVVPSRKVTFKGPEGTEPLVVDSTEFELGQANLETRWKIAKDRADAEKKRAEEASAAPTKALEQENKQLQAESTNKQLKRQRDNPTAPAVEMTDAEKEAAKSYFKQQEEINKSDVSNDVKSALLKDLDERMAPVLQRAYPHLGRAGAGGLAPESAAIIFGTGETAPAGAGPGLLQRSDGPCGSAPPAPVPQQGLMDTVTTEFQTEDQARQQTQASRAQAVARERAYLDAVTAGVFVWP